MTGRAIIAGWPTYAAVIAANAIIQAATTLPVATPAPTPLFVGLAVASFVALAAAVLLTVAQAASSADGRRLRVPSARLMVAGVLVLVAIAAIAVLVPPLLAPVITVALIVLPPIAWGDRWFAGFRAFARRPAASISLVLLTGVVIVVLWLGALLSGFFLAGVLSALLTWLVAGVIGVALVRAWTGLTRASRRPSARDEASPVD